ncbi:MAG: zinc ribbon domain-containing protein [Carboxydocellales bacterium]
MSDSDSPELYECDQCGETVSETDTICPNCGADVSEIKDIDKEVDKFEDIEPKSPSRYPALVTIATTYKVLAWIVVIMAVIAAINVSNNGLTVFAFLFGGLIGALTLMAFSEGIMVFIDIEENTRITAEFLRRQD